MDSIGIIILLVGYIIFFLADLAVHILLQIFLSKRESRWFGLVLPALSFLVSLIAAINIASYGRPLKVFLTFLIVNIETAILLTVYFACRERMRKRRNLDQTDVQDPE